MTDLSKIKPTHTQRAAFIYVRQSTPSQVEHNRESTARQYALADRACQLGWPQPRVVIIDEDLGLSGSSADKRSGFTRMTSEVSLGHVGIVLGLEVSRLARNNADWYRLLELCGLTDTLIADNDGVYHPALFNGYTSSAPGWKAASATRRLAGSCAAACPSALSGVKPTVKFSSIPMRLSRARCARSSSASLSSARRAGCGCGSAPRLCPSLSKTGLKDRFAGSPRPDEHGTVKKRMRHLPLEPWAVLIPNHHPGFIDWEAFQANQARLDSNPRPRPHQGGGALREGSALLQGLATCGHCGRRLHTHYRGRNSTPGYHCAGKDIVKGRGLYCFNLGGVVIDRAVAKAFLAAVTPAAVEATLLTVQQLQNHHDAALA